LRSHNRLLGNYRIQVLGKTGWTRAAKKCFVGAARADGREIGVAVLGSTDLWGDLKRLLDYGFGVNGAPEPALPAMQVAATASAAGDDDEPKVSAQPAHRYFVSVSAFRARRSAARLRSSLARAGYRASIQSTRRGGHALYRVLVGSYSSRRAADQAAAKLRRKTQRPPTVLLVRS
jgi:D-alanyl-D-alanine carboxypeptidase